MTKHSIAFLFLLSFLGVQCTSSENRIAKDFWDGELTSDAESIKGSWIGSNQSSVHLQGNFNADTKYSLSGTTSISLDESHKQGFALEITGMKFLDQLTAKVWRRKSGNSSDLSIKDKSNLMVYSMPTGKTNGDWEELQVNFTCYSERAVDTLLVQCMFLGTAHDTAWFDDFSCAVTSPESRALQPPSESQQALKIEYSDEAANKLATKRNEALAVGVLVSQKSDLVKATINNDKAVKLRLKGDWTDHLLGDKWSMRIEVKDGEVWNGFSKFSIQNPITKSLMNEWVFHKMLANENVLTTAYSFIPVELNGNHLGTMAVEEHFTAQLISNAKRPRGPILKFNEDHLWDMRANKISQLHNYPIEQAAEVEVYSRKSFASTLKRQQLMERGRSLLYAHQHNLLPLDSIFNVDLLAKYFAVAELMGASHSYFWHNLRYYYNCELDRLEPIGIDGNPTLKPTPSKLEIVDGFKKTYFKHARMLNLCASDSFRSKFLHYLQTFSSKTYLDNFFETVQTEYNAAEEMLQREYLNYEFPIAQLYCRAAQIGNLLPQPGGLRNHTVSKKLVAEEIKSSPIVSGVSVVAYQTGKSGDSTMVCVVNYHHQQINIENAVGTQHTLKACANAHEPSVETFYFSGKLEQIKFTAAAEEQVYELSISNYRFPTLLP